MSGNEFNKSYSNPLRLPLCACGCGNSVLVFKNKYIRGHNFKGVPKTDNQKQKLSEAAKGREGFWTGKKMPEEARARMSESGHKKKLSEEHKRKISESLKGRVVSEETIQKFVGKKQSLATRIKKSKALRGDKGPGWKGGISSPKNIEKNSMFFKEWRRKVLCRDNYTCQKCGVTNGNHNEAHIQTHHIMPFAEYPELRVNVDNGITLCEVCHKDEHKRLRRIGGEGE